MLRDCILKICFVNSFLHCSHLSGGISCPFDSSKPDSPNSNTEALENELQQIFSKRVLNMRVCGDCDEGQTSPLAPGVMVLACSLTVQRLDSEFDTNSIKCALKQHCWFGTSLFGGFYNF